MTKKTAAYAFIIFLAGICHATQVRLESYASSFDSIPIAVLRFIADGEEITKDHPWHIIADDFEFCGKFSVTRTARRDSVYFVRSNISLYIDGLYTLAGDSITMECSLHDAVYGDRIFTRSFLGSKKSLRIMAHRFSNSIYELLFGERGAFESRILFVRDKMPAAKEIFIMDYDGRNMRQMTNTGVINLFPCFLDSLNFLSTSYLKGKPDLFKGSITTGTYSPFVYSRFTESSPSVSLLFDKVAYASSVNGNLDIYVSDMSGLNRRQLTFDKAVDTAPCFSPSGYHIAFVSDRTGNPQIYVMDIEGAHVRRITFEGRYQDSPSWSPKGDRIAYTSLQKGKYEIWVIEHDGSNARSITSNIPERCEYPSWSPDGEHIVFQLSRGYRSDLYAIRPDGTGLKRLTDIGNAKMPDWSMF